MFYIIWASKYLQEEQRWLHYFQTPYFLGDWENQRNNLHIIIVSNSTLYYWCDAYMHIVFFLLFCFAEKWKIFLSGTGLLQQAHLRGNCSFFVHKMYIFWMFFFWKNVSFFEKYFSMLSCANRTSLLTLFYWENWLYTSILCFLSLN